MKDFHINGKLIGGEKCFIIAEIGVNHNGSVKLGKEHIDKAIDCGADAVKFQTWITEEVVSDSAPLAPYQEAGGGKSQFEMLKELELSFQDFEELKSYCDNRGIAFLSTPDDLKSAKFLAQLGVPALKVGSGEINNLAYLNQLSELDLPLILSTGTASLAEVEKAFCVLEKCPLAILHCVSSYPTPVEQLNLKAIETLGQKFPVPVGLSDHSVGTLAAVVSIGLGISILEKHFTLDTGMAGPDHKASADPEGFRDLVESVRMAETALGDGVKEIQECEEENLKVIRRHLSYLRDHSAGEILKGECIKALRCDEGDFGPNEVEAVVGRRLRVSRAGGESVRADDFEDAE